MSAFYTCCESISRSARNCFHEPFTKKNLIISGVVIGVIIVLIIVIVAATSSSHSKAPPAGSFVIREYGLVLGSNSWAQNIKKYLGNEINTQNFSIDMRNEWNKLKCDSCQTDLFRIRAGNVGTQMWTLEVNCSASQYKDAVKLTLGQIDVMTRLLSMYNIPIIRESTELEHHKKWNEPGGILSIRGGHSLDSGLDVLRSYYRLGVRAISLVGSDSSCLPPWIDKTSKLLKKFGKDIVLEMNRLGMMIDLSGAPEQTQLDVINTSKAPVIFTYSNAHNLVNHDANVKDTVLKSNSKIFVMLSFTPEQLNKDPTLSNMTDVLDHLNYFRQKNCKIGIGSNFDDMKTVPHDLEDPSKMPALFDYLGKKHNNIDALNEDEIKQIATRNFIEYWKNVEKVRDSLIKEDTQENTEDLSDFTPSDLACYSDEHRNSSTPTEPPTTVASSTTASTTAKTEPSTTATTVKTTVTTVASTTTNSSQKH